MAIKDRAIVVGMLLVGSVLWACGPQRTTTTPAASSASGALRPPARAEASVTYDSARHQLLLFGGSVNFTEELNDTWTWDGKAWTLRHAAVSPPGRQHGLLAFDGSRRVVVLFGGVSKGIPRNDTWTWDGKTWAEQHPATSPPARESGAIAYDPRMGTVILIGGNDNGGSLNDMWSWSGTTWTELHPNPLPQLVSEGIGDDGSRLIVTGGSFGDVNGRYLTQTWGWDGSRWSALHPPVNVPLDYGYSFAGDPKRGTVLFFGGGMGLIHQDTWVWDGSTWARRHPLTSPTERTFGHLVYDTSLGRALLYGGEGAAGQWLGDVWAWDGLNWNEIDPGPPMPASTARPAKGSISTMTPAEATAAIRTALQGTHPVLLPSWLPADLIEAQVSASEGGFAVKYVSDNRDKLVLLAIVVPNPRPGGPNQRSTQVRLLGVSATYFVYDATVPLSQRYLEWAQPGTGPAAGQLKGGGLPYFLSADGLTDAEFWQIANSLKG